MKAATDFLDDHSWQSQARPHGLQRKRPAYIPSPKGQGVRSNAVTTRE